MVRFDGRIFSTWPMTIKKHGPMFGIKPGVGSEFQYVDTYKHFHCRMCDGIIESNKPHSNHDCPKYNGGTSRSISPIRRHNVLRIRNLRNGIC